MLVSIEHFGMLRSSIVCIIKQSSMLSIIRLFQQLWQNICKLMMIWSRSCLKTGLVSTTCCLIIKIFIIFNNLFLYMYARVCVQAHICKSMHNDGHLELRRELLQCGFWYQTQATRLGNRHFHL